MPDLAELLRSSPSPPVEDVVGLVLEVLVKSGSDENPGNFAARFTGTPPRGTPTPADYLVFEAFQWLQSRNLIASASQPGWYFVTTTGKKIATADSLRIYLAQEKNRADAAYESTVKELAEMKKRVESDIAQAIEEAKKEAQSILSLARQTAQGISLDDVQDQFAQAAEHCLTGIWIWASLSLVLCVALIVAVVGFFTWWEPSFQTAAQTALNQSTAADKGFTIYHTVLRVTLLTAIAALATFCQKILRAQLHLREQNLHRQRVANSAAAFLGATTSPEQRDLVLSRLADAITAFGNSGLLADDDSVSPAKVILESVQRGLSSRS